MTKPLIQMYRVAFLGALTILVVILWIRIFAGETLQYTPSPDGENIAEYRRYKQSSATTTDLITIELRSRFNPIRHTVLSGLDYGATFSLNWRDSRNLIVGCQGCNPANLTVRGAPTAFAAVKKEERWNGVSILYALH